MPIKSYGTYPTPIGGTPVAQGQGRFNAETAHSAMHGADTRAEERWRAKAPLRRTPTTPGMQTMRMACAACLVVGGVFVGAGMALTDLVEAYLAVPCFAVGGLFLTVSAYAFLSLSFPGLRRLVGINEGAVQDAVEMMPAAPRVLSPSELKEQAYNQVNFSGSRAPRTASNESTARHVQQWLHVATLDQSMSVRARGSARP